MSAPNDPSLADDHGAKGKIAKGGLRQRLAHKGFVLVLFSARQLQTPMLVI
jgi:hypothetical protein